MIGWKSDFTNQLEKYGPYTKGKYTLILVSVITFIPNFLMYVIMEPSINFDFCER